MLKKKIKKKCAHPPFYLDSVCKINMEHIKLSPGLQKEGERKKTIMNLFAVDFKHDFGLW